MSDTAKSPDLPTGPEAAEAETFATERSIDRAAIADDETAQEFAADKEPAESSTAFGDDKVTPHLNDGR